MDRTIHQFNGSRRSPNRIFIDASHTVATGKNSGIERVVRSILAECSHWCENDGLPNPQLVTHHNGEFLPINEVVEKQFFRLASIESNVQSLLPRWYLNVAKRICSTTNSAKLRKWLLPQPGHLGLFKLAHTAMDSYIHQCLPRGTKPIAANENDLFILPDAYWTRRGVWKAAAKARQSGATTATVIYDLIPLTHPQYVGQKRTEGFRKYLHQAIEHSDLIVAISKTVEDELNAYIAKNRSEFARVPIDVRHVTLGAELKLVEGEVRDHVKELFAPKSSVDGHANPPYLMVATFDPRKNHHYLLDAFDMLWANHPELKLCLVGRVGSLCEDVVHRIRSHPALGTQLFAIHDMKDAELQFCYQACRGVIFPSIVEGFGLPIVDSLWFGKKTFASDTPIHREVGRNDCTYFDLSSPASLADAISEWESSAAFGSYQQPSRRPTTWEECSRRLIAHCLDAQQMLRAHTSVAKAA
jgi:alpha-1,2-rhamnosyltransferase